jgi:hypothetical protein
MRGLANFTLIIENDQIVRTGETWLDQMCVVLTANLIDGPRKRDAAGLQS